MKWCLAEAGAAGRGGAGAEGAQAASDGGACAQCDRVDNDGDGEVLKRRETVKHAFKEMLEQTREKHYAEGPRAARVAPVHEPAVLFDGKRTWEVTPESYEKRFPPRAQRSRRKVE